MEDKKVRETDSEGGSGMQLFMARCIQDNKKGKQRDNWRNEEMEWERYMAK